jgi:coenzyme F420-reducing hydrogenase delta subunit
MTKTKGRLEKMLPLLEEMGINSSRIFLGSTSASEGAKLAEHVSEFVKTIVKLGPLGSELTVTTKIR